MRVEMFVNEHAREVNLNLVYGGARWETVRATLELIVAKTADRSNKRELFEVPRGGIVIYDFDPQIRPWPDYGTRLLVSGFQNDDFGDTTRIALQHADAFVFVADADAALTQEIWAKLQRDADSPGMARFPLVVQGPAGVPESGVRQALGLPETVPVFPAGPTDVKGVFDTLKKATAVAIAAARAR